MVLKNIIFSGINNHIRSNNKVTRPKEKGGRVEMENSKLHPRLRLMQDADMKDKIVLVRVDHNVVKKGKIKDPYRIEATMGTLYGVVEKGGRPILMTHVGRPRDKKTGEIRCDDSLSVEPIVKYLRNKLPIDIHIPAFAPEGTKGIVHIDESVRTAIEDLKKGTIGMIYLPNTRWFLGEQSKGEEREAFCNELASLADLFVNDAFGSWQAHVSTYDIAMKLPSYAGFLLQKELIHLDLVLNPTHPYVAVIAGAKYDTKIGPLKALYKKVDHLILGGLIYNTYLSAKYGIHIQGVSEEEINMAKELVQMDEKENKILELPYMVESEITDGREEGKWRKISLEEMKKNGKINYIVDVAPECFELPSVKEAILSAKTIFVNAVVGLMPFFHEGSARLYQIIFDNHDATKLFGGGDTLQELKNLAPRQYLVGLDSADTYYFTGGGSVLAAIEQNDPYHIKPIEALMA